MAGNGLLKRRLSLFDTAFVLNRQCKGHQRLMKSSVTLVLRLATTSKEFVLTPYQAQQIASKKLSLTVSLLYAFYDYIPYSGFYLRGPNFCEICEVLTSSQILILKLLFYFHETATEHVILAPGYVRKTYIANISQISVYVRYVSYYCSTRRAFTCNNGKGSWRFCLSR